MEMEHFGRTKGQQSKPRIRVRAGKPHPNPVNFDHRILNFRNPSVGWATAEEYSKRPREVHSRMAWLREQLDETKPNPTSEGYALEADDIISPEELQELQLMFGRKKKEVDSGEQLMYYNHMAIAKMLKDVGVHPQHPDIQDFMQEMFEKGGDWSIRKYLRDPKNIEVIKQMMLTERN